ncbi:ABC transporter permease [Verrucomicrobium spinosum]|uniref:ABC transporter permease n=1 Tax=Verrucomicrobium spinosum TaxID=2736 RepID=UPI0001746159|nr:ABC transporter permease [Verrucomicrobium spinosum]
MNPRIVSALVLRYLYLYGRTPMRLIELIFWPIVELLIWGYLSMYLKEHAGAAIPTIVGHLLGGIILWDVIFRAQQGVAISFLEDVWTRNLLNVFVAPVRNMEYLAATFIIGFFRILVTVTMLSVISFSLYQFSVFEMHWAILPFFGNLLVTGWALGMISTALILRWGQAAESLAWAVPFFIQPFTAVVYPVAMIKPEWVQYVAQALPSTHVFEGMREMLSHHTFNWPHFFWACGLNVVFLGVAGWIFSSTLNTTRKRGLLTKFATQ